MNTGVFLVAAFSFTLVLNVVFLILDFLIQALLWTCHYTLWTYLLSQMSWEMPGSQPKMSPVQGRALRGNDAWIFSAWIQGHRIGSSSTFRNLWYFPTQKKYYVSLRRMWLLKCSCDLQSMDSLPCSNLRARPVLRKSVGGFTSQISQDNAHNIENSSLNNSVAVQA